MRKLMMVVLAGMLILGVVTAAQAQDLKIGFADKVKLFYDYNKTKDLNKSLEEESIKARDEFEAKSAEIRKMNDEMALLSESARKEKQPQLDARIKDFEDMRRVKSQELARKQDEGFKGIVNDIKAVCETYGKANGYNMIIDKNVTLYFTDGQDVTEAILAELNKKQ